MLTNDGDSLRERFALKQETWFGTLLSGHAAGLAMDLVTLDSGKIELISRMTYVEASRDLQRIHELPANWIKEELWVETSFDSDGDGRLDRMHVFVTRPVQTQAGNLQLPVIYTSSPYYGLKIWALLGLSSRNTFWPVKHELGEVPKKRKHTSLGTRTKRPLVSFSMDPTWVSRGYIVVYSSSPGTGLSDGAPTIGGENESLAPKAVIDWLCGRAKGYSTRTGYTEVTAFWSNGKAIQLHITARTNTVSMPPAPWAA